jgi:hypothetical protein
MLRVVKATMLSWMTRQTSDMLLHLLLLTVGSSFVDTDSSDLSESGA